METSARRRRIIFHKIDVANEKALQHWLMNPGAGWNHFIFQLIFLRQKTVENALAMRIRHHQSLALNSLQCQNIVSSVRHRKQKLDWMAWMKTISIYNIFLRRSSSSPRRRCINCVVAWWKNGIVDEFLRRVFVFWALFFLLWWK